MMHVQYNVMYYHTPTTTTPYVNKIEWSFPLTENWKITHDAMGAVIMILRTTVPV